jgi:hypothetical protein
LMMVEGGFWRLTNDVSRNVSACSTAARCSLAAFRKCQICISPDLDRYRAPKMLVFAF